jgi:hypothetical protein
MVKSSSAREKYLAAGAHVVYNISDWSLGFSTAIPLYGERAAAVAYVCKYVTKSPQKIGGRWYYSGGALQRADVVFLDLDVRDLQARGAYSFALPDAGMNMSILRGNDVGELAEDGRGIFADGGAADGAD